MIVPAVIHQLDLSFIFICMTFFTVIEVYCASSDVYLRDGVTLLDFCYVRPFYFPIFLHCCSTSVDWLAYDRRSSLNLDRQCILLLQSGYNDLTKTTSVALY